MRKVTVTKLTIYVLLIVAGLFFILSGTMDLTSSVYYALELIAVVVGLLMWWFSRKGKEEIEQDNEAKNGDKNTLLGGISITIGISVGCGTALFVGMFVLARLPTLLDAIGIPFDYSETLALFVFFFGQSLPLAWPFLLVLPFGALIGLTIGIVGLLQKGHNRSLPTLGIAFNALPLAAIIGLVLLYIVIY